MNKLESVSLEDARRVIEAGERKAREIGQPSNVAVVDAGGNLVAHIRMDGSWIGSVDISINKAFTARAFDISTADLADNAGPGEQFFGIHESNGGRVMIFAGGIPLRAGARSSARWASVAAPVIRTRPWRKLPQPHSDHHRTTTVRPG